MSLSNLNLADLKATLRKPHNLFLLFGLVFGTLLCLVTPPLQVPDEFAHFARAYQFAQGGLFSEHKPELGTGLNTVGGQLPLSMIELDTTYAPFSSETSVPLKPDHLFESLREPLDKDNTTFAPISAFNYSPVPYIGSIIACFIGQATNMSPLLMMYLGRIFNLFIALTLIYFAIKLTPRFKWILLLLALMPMTIFQLASLSADSIGIGVAFLAIAVIFSYAFSTKVMVIENKHILIMIVLFAVMALWKQAYAPFALLYFLIPMSKVGSRQKYFRLGALVLICSVLPMLLWSLANASIISAATTPVNQFSSILTNPLGFAKMFFLTYYSQSGLNFFLQTFGVLGWLNIPVSFLFHTLPYFVVIVLAVLHESKRIVFSLSNKLVLALVSTGVIGLISLSLYLIWTPPENTIIDGIQGRYFIPIIPLIIGILSTRQITLTSYIKHPKLILFGLLAVSCLFVGIRLITYYYF